MPYNYDKDKSTGIGMEEKIESSDNRTDGKAKKSIAGYIVPAVLVAIMAVSGAKAIYALNSYRTANAEYDSLEEYARPAATAAVTTETSDDTEEELPAYPEIPAMDIDFEALADINEDFKGWLTVPALDINYPVVQGIDNEQYLHETFEHVMNKSGAIFMDSYNYPDFKDFNTFIFGHNMRDKSMFGSLKALSEEPERVDAHPYIYVYTPRASYQFQIVAYYTTRKDSDTYTFLLKPEEYDRYVEYIDGVNELQNSPEVDYSEHPQMLTLSTCKGAAGTVNRFVIHSVLVNKVMNE